ncbi:MAG TPA: hypothetical protein PLI27_01660 [Ignavibacteriales bacterium]|nr:hypothetical protein [Ignavibacteriales bacterium]HOL80960.1 hypothetical protein [Ignavibacteriales bacterium]HOM64695.1 hypothetical protein [Ignavibacteriales bacterium]HPD66773.1 hypothetical protein [Ignavibacteriales bacterium]HPP32740.1 hypothetical protein [Ignavibacteriales bacterium]
MISEDLLKILCCPLSKAPLILFDNYLISTDKNTRKKYKIVDNIPVLLIDEAEEIPFDEWKDIMKKNNYEIK